MADHNNSQTLCPYCIALILIPSRDHIFPQFLGGKRKVDCCKNCNSVFGHTFEAEAAKILQAEHVFISSWGIPLRSADPTWRAAHVQDGKSYDLSIGQTGVKPELAKPVIKLDEEGGVESGEFVDKKQADRFARSLIEKEKAREVKLEVLAPPQIDLTGLGHTLVLGPDIRRTALKMCIALSTLLPDSNLEDISEARLFLRGDRRLVPVNNTLAAYNIYEAIDSRRKALSHVIYLERSQSRVYGLVQFFGVTQLFCRLGVPKSGSESAAIFASLDPVTGEEEISATFPLDLTEPPYFLSRDEYPQLIGGWLKKYRAEAITRGATHPPDLRMESLTIESSSFSVKKPN
jgi:hypothetical protein